MKTIAIFAALILVGSFSTPAFAEKSGNSKGIFSTGYEIDSQCDLAHYLNDSDSRNYSGIGYFDLSGMPTDDPDAVKRLQDIVYAKYEPWEIETDRAVQLDVAKIKRDFVYDLEVQYALKHHDINPKFYRAVDLGLHLMSSSNFDEENYEFKLYANMISPKQYGHDKQCEIKYLKEHGTHIKKQLSNIYHDDANVNTVWSEIKNRAGYCDAEQVGLDYKNCTFEFSFVIPSDQWDLFSYDEGIIDENDPLETTLFSLDLITQKYVTTDMPFADMYIDVYDATQVSDMSTQQFIDRIEEYMTDDPFTTDIVVNQISKNQISIHYTMLGDTKYDCREYVHRGSVYEYQLSGCVAENILQEDFEELLSQRDEIISSFRVLETSTVETESKIQCGKGTIDIDGVCQVENSKKPKKSNSVFSWIFDLFNWSVLQVYDTNKMEMKK